MKIEIEIPDWAAERDIYVMAGVEQLAFIPFNKNKIWIKTERCNFCGKCCSNLTPLAPFPQTKQKGVCDHLYLNECSLGYMRPWSCSVSDPHIGGKEDEKEWCSIRYEVKDL